jgi:hypothetical protein
MEKKFVVIHPLFDDPEEKVSTENLSPISMTPSVRLSFMSLRAYLLLMIGMLVYHFFVLAVR